MIDETPVRPARRISVVARALKPLQRQIGELQDQVAFLVARDRYALRRPGDELTVGEIDEKRKGLAEVAAELDATVNRLPDKHRSDTRLRDVRASLDRLGNALDELMPHENR